MWRLKRLNSPMISVLLFESRRTKEASSLNAEGRSFLRFSHLWPESLPHVLIVSDCCVKSTSFTTPHIGGVTWCGTNPKVAGRAGLAGKPHD